MIDAELLRTLRYMPGYLGIASGLFAWSFDLNWGYVAAWGATGIIGGVLMSAGYWEQWLDLQSRSYDPPPTVNQLEPVREYYLEMGTGHIERWHLPPGIIPQHVSYLGTCLENDYPLTEAFLVDEMGWFTQTTKRALFDDLEGRGWMERTRKGKRAGYAITEQGREMILQYLDKVV